MRNPGKKKLLTHFHFKFDYSTLKNKILRQFSPGKKIPGNKYLVKISSKNT